jgi:hypothetical protein
MPTLCELTEQTLLKQVAPAAILVETEGPKTFEIREWKNDS